MPAAFTPSPPPTPRPGQESSDKSGGGGGATSLNLRRQTNSLYALVPSSWSKSCVDFCTNDILSLSSSGLLRSELLSELVHVNPDFPTGSGGSRLVDGNFPYLEQTEAEIASLHGAETGLILNSGFEANVAIWSTLPRPGDVMLYDELVHASTHEGMGQSLVPGSERVMFKHNDVEDFERVLRGILRKNAGVRMGRRSVLVAVESVYSMDGDVCPLTEMVEVAKEVMQGKGGVEFVVDEAHSTGAYGPRGAGLVSALGLEREVAVRVHTFGKAMGGSGAIVLASQTIKTTLLNFARGLIFSTAPSFPFVAGMRAGCNLLSSGRTQPAQDRLQSIIRFFYTALMSHPGWEHAVETGLLSVPLAQDWESRPFLTHIIPLWTRQKYTHWLNFHLLFAGFYLFHVEHPVVPHGQSRLKLTLHADNTEEQVQGLVDALYEWIDEMEEIEESTPAGGKIQATGAAREVYAWMKQQGWSGFGMPA
ncbi:putative aminotransferase [Cladorrhinum sp. PSN332]|nr:putative aminotransferase [Cladorrhinum sp. PSN332]